MCFSCACKILKISNLDTDRTEAWLIMYNDKARSIHQDVAVIQHRLLVEFHI